MDARLSPSDDTLRLLDAMLPDYTLLRRFAFSADMRHARLRLTPTLFQCRHCLFTRERET